MLIMYGIHQCHDTHNFIAFQRFCADIISVLGMTFSDNKESLKYRLLGSKEAIGSWGHEYVRLE